MRYFTFYEAATGDIRASGTCPDDQYDAQRMDGLAKIEGRAKLGKDYVEGGQIKPKAAMNVQLIGSSLVGLPNPSAVRVENQTYIVTDGRLDITFQYPGTYKVWVCSTKYLDFETEITVQSP